MFEAYSNMQNHEGVQGKIFSRFRLFFPKNTLFPEFIGAGLGEIAVRSKRKAEMQSTMT